MEDSTSFPISLLNCTSSSSVQNVVFLCEYLFYFSFEMNDNGETFSLAPAEYILR